jgi:hypothetical protein
MNTQKLGDPSCCGSWPLGPLDKADLGTNEERIENASTQSESKGTETTA